MFRKVLKERVLPGLPGGVALAVVLRFLGEQSIGRAARPASDTRRARPPARLSSTAWPMTIPPWLWSLSEWRS